MSRTISIKQDAALGEIHYVRSSRARRINIRILPERVEVRLPRGVKESVGTQFLESIRSRVEKQKRKAEKKLVKVTQAEPLQTATFTVRVKETNRDKIFSSLKSGILSIEYPESLDENDMQTQRYFWNSIDYFLRSEAKRILPPRTAELAKKHDFTVNGVKIQSSKTRWGSCNSKKVINLSFYLLLLPPHLIDYVILHELCHTVEMNHSARFWALMDRVTDGKSAVLRSELKKQSIPKI